MKEKVEQADFESLTKWCSLQERCTQEVRERLRKRGCTGRKADQLVERLMDLDFLNELRFAESYARSRAIHKGWGSLKIAAGLRSKGIASSLVDAALAELPAETFSSNLHRLVERRKEELPEGRERLIRWLLARGFRLDEIILEVDAAGRAS